MRVLKFIPFVLIAVVLLGCSFTVNVPSINTSVTQTFAVSQSKPIDYDHGDIQLEMGGGRLNITGGSDQWLSGTVKYNVSSWEPTLSLLNNQMVLTQEHSQNLGIPDGNIINDWTLQMGDTPTSLEISAGAYAGTLDFSGVPLTNLEINDGASKATVRFDSLNPAVMQRFVYKTGASSVELLGLANANTDSLTFSSGAGDYTLDFSGQLTQDMNVKVSSGLSQVKIVIPQGTSATINLNGGLSNVETHGTWTVNGTQYQTSGSGPTLTIDVEMAVGNLVLQQQ
jgi:hypothetical protein